MTTTKRLYRVVRESCYDAGSHTEVHGTEVLYCGYDKLEAVRAYHANPSGQYGGAGSHYTRVRAQSRPVSED
jgi:20S proteasome alpha/beta subunit